MTPFTTRYYRQFLECVPKNTTIYDIGIGNARALLNNRDVIVSKNLKIIGFDINDDVLSIANAHVQRASLEDRITLNNKNIMEVTRIPKNSCVVFSNSWALIENSTDILSHIKNIIDTKGTIYILTTLEDRVIQWKQFLKKNIRYILGRRLDFGRTVGLRELKEQLSSIFRESYITYNNICSYYIPIYGNVRIYNVTIPITKLSFVNRNVRRDINDLHEQELALTPEPPQTSTPASPPPIQQLQSLTDENNKLKEDKVNKILEQLNTQTSA